MKKNIVIVHYNTPRLTECLVKSINLFVEDANIYIFDNSDKLPFTAKFDNVTVWDNTKGDIINFSEWLGKYPERLKTSAKRNNFASAKHCYSIEKCMELMGENFMLLDSDILLKKDISDLFDDKYVFISATETWRGKARSIPYICYINVDSCKENDIHYFEDKHIYGLSKVGDRYDTGANFYEQVVAKKLNWKKISFEDYIVHYKAASWVESAKKFDGYKPMDSQEWLKKYKKYWYIEKNKKVVYTCITGGYDTLVEPTYVSDGFDYICFTDNLNMKSNIWTLKPLPNETEELSQVKKQRYVKLNPHLLLKEYDISIWIDGNVTIKGNLNKFVQDTIKEDCSIYVPQHPTRKCIYKEASAVLSMNKDKKEIVGAQMERYKDEGFPENCGLLQSNILLRKHNNEDCIKLMEAWFEELKDNSHRDQLSFNYVLWKNKDIKVIYMDKNICKSKYFFWKASHKEKRMVRNTNHATTQTKTRNIEQAIKEFHEIINKTRRVSTYKVPIYY